MMADLQEEGDMLDVFLLVAKAEEGRGAKELNARAFSAQEKAMYDEADAKERKSWREKEAFEQLTEAETQRVLKDKKARVMPGRARVVRTNKADTGSPVQAKSRIVVPGHNDQDLGDSALTARRRRS